MHRQSRSAPHAAHDADAARVQPVEAPKNDHVPTVPAAWVAQDEHQEEADRVDRLLADAELVTTLQLHRFDGPKWERFATELARYGIAVLRSWMRSGLIFTRLKTRGVGVPALPPSNWTNEEIDDIANLTVAVALGKFRETVLIPGRWDPNRGASLRTFFVGQCLIRWPNVYREWRTEATNWASQHGPAQEEEWEHTAGHHHVEREVVATDAARRILDRMPDDRTRRAVVLRSEGATHQDIAEDLGCTVKAVEHLLHRHRQRLAKERHDRAS